MSRLTDSQRAAVLAQGNVLLEAGAGSGKTSTLVQRCLHRLFDAEQPLSLEAILMVTFTEAAAAEMRRRIRAELNQRLLLEPANERLREQLALLEQAHIGTLHSFCFRLVREHFHELGLDPQTRVLDEGEARLIASDTIGRVLDECYEGAGERAERIRNFIRIHGSGNDVPIAELVVATHRFLETLPNRGNWLERERERWECFDLARAEAGLMAAVKDRVDAWHELLEGVGCENENVAQCALVVGELARLTSRAQLEAGLARIVALEADELWPRGTKTRYRIPMGPVFEEARFYLSLARVGAGMADPLEEDFVRAQPHMLALVDLVSRFSTEFAARKRAQQAMDFADLEQFSLRLLVDAESGRGTPIAVDWRRRFGEIFVDEYQDINEAQDRILSVISGEEGGENRFLVGDVKQSIYGFRLARPDIFLGYAEKWRRSGTRCQVLPLRDNFRSHESILDFVNEVFTRALRRPIGGIRYGEGERLVFGSPETRGPLSRRLDPRSRVEFTCRFTSKQHDENAENAEEEFSNAEKEAQMVLDRLVELRRSAFEVFDPDLGGCRPVEWRDMAILLRATSQKAEIYTRMFSRAGVPLVASRRGFFDASEVSDLVSLMTILDNPLQDIPLLAVLRSPIVGLGPDELVSIRLAAPHEPHLWTALQRFAQTERRREAGVAGEQIDEFLKRFARWRVSARRGSLSRCLEDILETTRYLAWLAAQPGGATQVENVQRMLDLVRQYDSWSARGLNRFLDYVRLVSSEGEGPEPAAPSPGDAVQLMTIHASKGLEFPVVVLADLGKRFNRDRPLAGVAVDEEGGICPTVFVPEEKRSYSSLALRQLTLRMRERETAEELRLLYVALTRASDMLLLVATASAASPVNKWQCKSDSVMVHSRILRAGSLLDFLGPLLPDLCQEPEWFEMDEGSSRWMNWRVVREDSTPRRVEYPTTQEEPADVTAVTFDGAALRDRLRFNYPFLESTRRHGKTTVTRIRRQMEAGMDEESVSLFADIDRAAKGRETRPHRPGVRGLSAAQVGIAYHGFFQHTRLDRVGSLADLEAERDRLSRAGLLGPDESTVVDLSRVLAFWQGEVGQAFLKHQDRLRRELPFTAAFSESELGGFAGFEVDNHTADDLVIVQGVADLVALLDNEVWVLDFKSDRLEVSDLEDRVAAYRPQVQLYQRALQRICRKPVTRLWLHFLHLARTVEVNLE